MAVRLSALRTSRALLPRNIIILMFLVLKVKLFDSVLRIHLWVTASENGISVTCRWWTDSLSLRKLSRVELSWVELSYGRRSVDQLVLISGSPLGPMTRFYPYPFFSGNCFVVLPVERPLWREDGSVTYSAISGLSGHWEPITIHYRLIWDCVPS
jgi:hypothetical protein